MESGASVPVNQVLAYRFDSGSSFEGQLGGALERLEAGGAMRVLDAVFVARERETGELVAVNLTPDGSGGMIGTLLDFRLDARKRSATTQRALESELGADLRTIGETLEPGAAFAAVMVEHTWALTLGDAIARLGGAEIANEFVDDGGFRQGTVARWLENPD